ncbi:MAG: glycosyltransferase [Candidatus Moranbacteria bacterium]|nr:glycosyltransferase [Candidatus Moranbacteria bacterium]
MNLLLIKIGKALHTLKREGLWRGGRRVSKAFFALFRRVGSGDVLFITGGVGDSALYRAHHVAEELEIQGLTTGITVQDNPFLPSYADKFSVFIFHRVLYTPSVAKLMERIKAQDKEIIFETDDLVFDPQYLKFMDYFQKMNNLERKLYENGVGGEILNDPYVKVCTTTTTFLAEKLREKGKRVFIVPNKLTQEDVAVAEAVIANKCHSELVEESASVAKGSLDYARDDNRKNTIKIGYFSGTLSHNKDFATITDALATVLEKYPQTRLFLVGPLETESKLSVFADRIEQFPYAARAQHFANVASVDINLAPLEIGNPFCESKSELKFFEAGIVGVPTVASATAPYKEAIEDGVDGFVASTTEEWVEKLCRLIEDAPLRTAMGEKAKAKAMQKYTTANAQNKEYYEYLHSKVTRSFPA